MKNFLRHAPCMRHVKKDYEVCAIHYQSTMAKIGQSVATTTTTTKYMQCSEFTVRHACGDETALFTRKFLDKMSNTLMRMHCVDYTPESGKCRDYFSSSATPTGLTRWSSSNMVTLAIVTVFAVVHTLPVHAPPAGNVYLIATHKGRRSVHDRTRYDLDDSDGEAAKARMHLHWLQLQLHQAAEYVLFKLFNQAVRFGEVENVL
uniref:Uncharacterized protein n=1 Tax=Anopheles coluzzii TaxID=1518534 RepID=A0A8W7PH76_ANOCL